MLNELDIAVTGDALEMFEMLEDACERGEVPVKAFKLALSRPKFVDLLESCYLTPTLSRMIKRAGYADCLTVYTIGTYFRRRHDAE